MKEGGRASHLNVGLVFGVGVFFWGLGQSLGDDVLLQHHFTVSHLLLDLER